MFALAEYNANPYSLHEDITFAEMYKRWSAEKYSTISQSNVNGYKAAYNLCSDLYDMKVTQIRRNHLQAVVDNSGKNYPTLRKLKVLLNQMYTYAIQNDLCDKDYSEFIDIAKHKDKFAEDIHKPFIEHEIHTLWHNAPRSRWIQTILMMITSGVRVGELLDLKQENVHLTERYFEIKKSKTAAGIRKVPIAEIVVPYWKQWMDEPSYYVIHTSDGSSISYSTYLTVYFQQPLDQIGVPDHLPHDTRHTFISLATASRIDRILIKRIVGHQGEDVTDKVYTHYDVKQIVDAVNQINFLTPEE